MGRRTARATVLAVVLLLAVAGTALAIRIQAGNIVVTGDGGFTPTALPKNVDAPITIFGHGKISTVDGTLPPVLKTIQFEFDKHGSVETTGLAVCTAAKLQATTVPVARKLCPGAIVGKGFGHAIVKFPEQAPIPVSSPITIFNGPPKHGNPTVFAHAYLEIGGPSTFIVPVEIQKIDHGRYGFRTEAEIPEIVNGYGTPLYGRLKIGKTWKYKGKTLSYANAHCADGRLQAEGQFTFEDGTYLQGTIFKPCQVRK